MFDNLMSLAVTFDYRVTALVVMLILFKLAMSNKEAKLVRATAGLLLIGELVSTAVMLYSQFSSTGNYL